MDRHKTKVVFRKFKDGGDIVAVFPRDLGTNSPYTCGSYMHVGQHGSADPNGVVSITKLATPAEYAPLARELKGLGYNLDIRTKITYDDLLERQRLLKDMDKRAAKRK